MASPRLFHITTRPEFEMARAFGQYRSATFAAEGFIHCSYGNQVAATADRLFRNREDLVVLEIDPSKLPCRVIDENLEGGAELFPHVYGAVPLHAVTAVHPLTMGPDGRFIVPAAVTSA